MDKLYKRILTKFPSLFNEKAKAEIEGMLADKPDNKYLVAVVMGPYIDGSIDASRLARTNYLVFMDEVANVNGPFAREEGETPLDRLSWFYTGIDTDHPLYKMLMKGENGVRTRKGIAPMDDSADEIYTIGLTNEQEGAYDEIKNHDYPVENFWWPEENPPRA